MFPSKAKPILLGSGIRDTTRPMSPDNPAMSKTVCRGYQFSPQKISAEGLPPGTDL